MKEKYDNLPQFDNSIFIQEYVNREGKSQKLAYYQRGNFISRTSFGQQYEVRKYSGAIHDYLGEILRMKIIKKQYKTKLKQSIYDNQIMISKLINNQQSKRFTKLVTHWTSEKCFYIILEKSKIGNLYELANLAFNNNLYFTEQQILWFTREILKGIQILHDIKIMHRDIKLHNIQIDENFELKIGQFSAAKITFSGDKPEDNRVYGTPHYMAPQIMQIAMMKQKKSNKAYLSKKYSSQVDIWSLGIALYYLIYRKYPFDTVAQHQYYKKIITQDIPFQQINQYQQVINLLKNILIKQPSKRPQPKQILNFQCFTKLKPLQIKKILLTKFQAYMNHKLNLKKQWTRQINKIRLQFNQETLYKIQNKRKVKIIKVYRDKKYGFFFLLSNFNFCAFFNDGKNLKFDKNIMNYQSSQNNYAKIIKFIFKNYFQHFCNNQNKEQIEQIIKYQPNCKIFKLSIINNALLVRLTNQVLQIFFAQENNPCLYDKYLEINSNEGKKQEIRFINNDNQTLYQNYQKGLNSIDHKYFDYSKKVLQLMLDNSIIPKEGLTKKEQQKQQNKEQIK